MAVKVADKAVTPKSTGAAPFDPEPVTREAPVDNSSTGAVSFEAEPLETVVTHLDEPVTVTYPTPGAVTVRLDWLNGDDTAEEPVVEAKVVEAPEPDEVATASVPVETK